MKNLIVAFALCVSLLPSARAEDISPTTPAPLSIGSLVESCYHLDCLWHALYGPHNPLKPYIRTLERAINELARTRRSARRNGLIDAAEDVADALHSKLSEIHGSIQSLLSNYQLTPIATATPVDPLAVTPPSAYTAAPLPTSSPAATDATLQSLFQTITQLQQTQSSATAKKEKSSLEEQCALFGVGLLVLAAATYGLRYRLTRNMRQLEQRMKDLQKSYTAPHTSQKTGMIGAIECAIHNLPPRSR